MNKENFNDCTILILASIDFLELQISLPMILKNTNKDIDVIVCVNGTRYLKLIRPIYEKYKKFYKNLKIISADTYYSISCNDFIKKIINEEVKTNYVLKIDADNFPLKNDWVENLYEGVEKTKSPVACGLTNTSTDYSIYMFLQKTGLLSKFFNEAYLDHFSGPPDDSYSKEVAQYVSQFLDVGEKWNENNSLDFRWWGSFARGPASFIDWIHKQTTFKPEWIISKFKNVKNKDNFELVSSKEYYLTISNIFFEKEWYMKNIFSSKNTQINHDEVDFNIALAKSNQKYVICKDTPMIHVHRGNHRLENFSIIWDLLKIYEPIANIDSRIDLYNKENYNQIMNELYRDDISYEISKINYNTFFKYFVKIVKKILRK